jgi:hypothetical protein
MACRPAAGRWFFRRLKAINSRTGGGAAWSLPLLIGAEMDAKTRNLALLAGLSLFCTGVAWLSDYFVSGSIFFALGVVAAVEIALDL